MSDHLSPAHRLAIARGLALATPVWREQVRHDLPSRDAIRILAHDTYEAWLIGWPPGHATAAHDHGESAAAVVVVDGELVEERRGGIRVARAGDSFTVEARVIHDVRNDADRPATSIHVYSPPLTHMQFFDADGLPDSIWSTDDAGALLDHREGARALHPAGSGRD